MITIEIQCELLVRPTRSIGIQTDADNSNSHQGEHNCIAIDHSCINPSIHHTEYTSPKTAASSEHNTYLPGSSGSQCESDNEPAMYTLYQKKFIVFEELDKLFVSCPTCYKPVAESYITFVGSMVVVQLSCINGHKNKWQSQPIFNGKITGNVTIAASILFSSNTYASVNSLGFISIFFLQSLTKHGESTNSKSQIN